MSYTPVARVAGGVEAVRVDGVGIGGRVVHHLVVGGSALLIG